VHSQGRGALGRGNLPSPPHDRPHGDRRVTASRPRFVSRVCRAATASTRCGVARLRPPGASGVGGAGGVVYPWVIRFVGTERHQTVGDGAHDPSMGPHTVTGFVVPELAEIHGS